MSDHATGREVRVAALQRERAALANKPYPSDRQETKDRRLSEIDDALAELGERPAEAPAPSSSRSRRERAVSEG